MKSSFNDAPKEEPKKKSISKGHINFTAAESGYFNEMISKEEKTRWDFSMNKLYLSRPRDPTVAEKTSRSDYEYYLPLPKKGDMGDLPDLAQPYSKLEDPDVLSEQRRIEALKKRKALLTQELHELKVTMGDKKTVEWAVQSFKKPELPKPKPRGIRYTLQMSGEGFNSSATPECIDRIMLKRLR
jgi:hypothetical protein